MHDDELLYEGLRPGVLFAARYELRRVLGQGGFGRVFLAHDQALDTSIALKVLSPALAEDERHLKRFRREVLIARKISHRNVCKLFDIGQVGGLLYLTMEYVDGPSLHSLLRSRGAFPVSSGLEVCRQVAAGLEAAHSEGVVHRDLKPHNILIDKAGTAKILDFGIARSVDSSGITATGAMIGTPTYMSPEQCRGERGDFRSDLYSFGVLMYQLFTGVPPFSADTPLGILFLHVQQTPPSPLQINPALPAQLVAVILKCLAKEPGQRYQSAGEVLAGLQACPSVQAESPQALPAEVDTLRGELTTKVLGGSGAPAEATPTTREAPGAGQPAEPGGKPWTPDLPTPVSTGPLSGGVPQTEAVSVHEPGVRAPLLDDQAPTPRANGLEPSAVRRSGVAPVAILAGVMLVVSGAWWLWQTGWMGPADSSELDGPPRSGPEPLQTPITRRAARNGVSDASGPGHSRIPTGTTGSAPAGAGVLGEPVTTLSQTLTPTPSPSATQAEVSTTPPSPTDSPTETGTPAPRPAATPSQTGTDTPRPTAAPTHTVTNTPSPTASPTETGTPSPTASPTETGTPSPTPMVARAASPAGAPTAPAPGPASPSLRPSAAPRRRDSPSPRPSPTVAPQWVEDLILGGAPEDTQLCIDGRPAKATRLGLSFMLDPVPAGSHTLRLISRERGFAELAFTVLAGAGQNPPIKVSDPQWDPPRYRAVLRAPDASVVELHRVVGAEEQIRLESGEVLHIQVAVQEQALRVRRADGRSVQKPCSRKSAPGCSPPAPLECGSVTLPP